MATGFMRPRDSFGKEHTNNRNFLQAEKTLDSSDAQGEILTNFPSLTILTTKSFPVMSPRSVIE